MAITTPQQIRQTDGKQLKLVPFIRFGYMNYMRQHRYLRELAAAVIFTIFFGGFLTGPHLDDGIWWVFSVLLYGVRFMQPEYFLWLFARIVLLALLLLLSTLLLSVSYTRHPHWSWLIFLLLIFGNIVNKSKLLLIEGWSDAINLIVLLLPPTFEVSQVAVSLQFNSEGLGFLALALIQIWLLYWWNLTQFYRKDLF